MTIAELPYSRPFPRTPVLDDSFLKPYETKTVDWGFPSGPNSLGELVCRRTYLRNKDGRLETWPELCTRVVDGTFEILERHCRNWHLPFDRVKARDDAAEMYDRMFHFLFLPPGRGLWMMGTEFVRTRGSAALNNCGLASTKDIDREFSKPFRFLMDMSMLGVGVGFDTRGKNKIRWAPNADRIEFVVSDSREGWVGLIGATIEWAFGRGLLPEPDVSGVRPYGSFINGFGGVASGPEPLLLLYHRIVELARKNAGQPVTSRHIVDLMNFIGACVIAGNVRRTAEIAFGDHDDQEFIELKDYDKNPERAEWGWTSNNSIFARVGMNYRRPAKRTRKNGEPGYCWLENARAYGRMIDPPDYKDVRVMGTNPCGEQSLEPYELCTLVETFLNRHKSLDEFKRTLKYSYLYAKAVTLVPTHWEETNAVMLRNRRIGSSVSGVVQFVVSRDEDTLCHWLDEGYYRVEHYDRVFSDWLCVRESIKKTSVKPSGTVSLLTGATPGVHYPTYTYYIRRVRFAKDHPDIEAIRAAGYTVEDDVRDPSAVVAEFPVKGPDVPTEREVSMFKKIHLASLLQAYWADNQVSCTVTFDPETEGPFLEDVLSSYDRRLKGISFLPMTEEGTYPQMPYEAITKEEYEHRIVGLKKIEWPDADAHDSEEKYCDGKACQITA